MNSHMYFFNAPLLNFILLDLNSEYNLGRNWLSNKSIYCSDKWITFLREFLVQTGLRFELLWMWVFDTIWLKLISTDLGNSWFFDVLTIAPTRTILICMNVSIWTTYFRLHWNIYLSLKFRMDRHGSIIIWVFIEECISCSQNKHITMLEHKFNVWKLISRKMREVAWENTCYLALM